MPSPRLPLLAAATAVVIGASLAALPAQAATASVSDTAFTYTGSWTLDSPSEHYSGTVGASASINFTAGTGGSTVDFKGDSNGANGVVTASVDGGTGVDVTETGSAGYGHVMWTSPALAAGGHTLKIVVKTPFGSVEGADLSNGTFGGSGFVPPPPTGSAGPTAAFTASTLAVAFDASKSAAATGLTVSSYAWAFGDGATGTGKTVTHTYAAAGSYTARLTVTDSAGTATTTSEPVTVAAPATSTAGAPAPAPAPSPTPTGDTTQAAVVGNWGTAISSDEFNGTAVDTTKWGLYSGPGNSGNGTRTPTAISEANGLMTMAGDANDNTGGMSWAGTPGTKYGRYELRMRAFAVGAANGGTQYHPVLIQWPDSDIWPAGGEYDFAETDIGAPGMEAFMHHPDGSQDAYSKNPLDFTQWHNYAFEWSATGLTGWIDGVQWFHDTNASAQAPGPMHQTIQLDSNNPGTQQPAQMQVDWYRSYAAP